MPETYKGSLKHKTRPGRGRKGTLCPEWTHTGPNGALGTDPHAFDWSSTPAETMFQTAAIHSDGRRFATGNGVAFEAKPTADETWHGYPVPWQDVPAKIKNEWLARGLVKSADLKRYFSRPKKDIRWALDTDDA